MGSNLPPGVTAADIDRHFGGGHEHEFEGLDIEVFEDGAFILTHQCRRVVSPRTWHEETCGVERQTRLDARSVSVQQRDTTWNTIAESDTNVFHDTIAGDTELSAEDAEDIEVSIAEAICDGVDVVSHAADGVSIDCGPLKRVVYIDGVTFKRLPDQMIRVTYDNVSEEVIHE